MAGSSQLLEGRQGEMHGTDVLRAVPRRSTSPGLSVCEWSPEGLCDKSEYWIPNTDEILQLVKKKMN